MKLLKEGKRYAHIFCVAASLFTSGWAFSQSSDQPLKVIAAGPPGGSLDFIARVLAEGLKDELSRIVVVDNRAGVGGLIAANEIMKHPADGNTVLVTLDSLHTELPHLVKLPFDVAREIKPIAEIARSGLVIAGHKSLPAKSLDELMKYGKSRSGQLSFASYGVGGASHVVGEQFNQASGMQLTHVPYKGATLAVLDASAGHVPIIVAGIGNVMPIIKSGSVIPYAVTLPKRSIFLPDVPTFKELGYPQITSTLWIGLWLRTDVPYAAQMKLRDAAVKIMSNPEIVKKLADFGLEPGESKTPEELSASLQKSYEKRGEDLKKMNFKRQ